MASPSQMTAAVETPVPDEPNPSVSPQLPWASIPKFVPGTTNVQEYVQKMKFLAAMWPAEHLSLLAPRAALPCRRDSLSQSSQVGSRQVEGQRQVCSSLAGGCYRWVLGSYRVRKKV